MSNELEAMKRIQWQLAKGHLLAMLETYHSEPDRSGVRDTTEFDVQHRRTWDFIASVENSL